jgi:hypothetical protein
MKSKVYFIPLKDGANTLEQAKAMEKLYDFAKVSELILKNDFVAIKVHLGEEGNTTYIKPEVIKPVVDKVTEKSENVFLTETSTLYKGERHNAIKHTLLAHKRGFGMDKMGVPFIMSDGLLGNTEGKVIIDGELHKEVNVANEILSTDVLLVISHATGHIVTGIGACLKNLGMGLASRKGKRAQHSAMKPAIKASCIFCKKCIEWCPEDAIIEKEKKAWIVEDKCVGCGECLTVCRFDSVSFDWQAEAGFTQRSMAEHALGIVTNRKCFHFNFLVDMTKDCDCWNVPQEKVIPDIGILASSDPVAIDKASLDLTVEMNKKSIAELSYPKQNALIQIEHGAKIGLGSLEYELVKVE